MVIVVCGRGYLVASRAVQADWVHPGLRLDCCLVRRGGGGGAGRAAVERGHESLPLCRTDTLSTPTLRLTT